MVIFVVDRDERQLARLREQVLKAAPYSEVLCFSDTREALEAVSKQMCDVLFTEIEMPYVTGIGLAKKFKRINPRVNIIFMSDFKERAIQVFDIKPSGFQLKPLSYEAVELEMEDLRYPVTENVLAAV